MKIEHKASRIMNFEGDMAHGAIFEKSGANPQPVVRTKMINATQQYHNSIDMTIEEWTDLKRDIDAAFHHWDEATLTLDIATKDT